MSSLRPVSAQSADLSRCKIVESQRALQWSETIHRIQA
ncbi:hypothetical protein NIES2104_14960 [Leptolyngbya sp. NIES-2104]|nr:hypothetical protein NIES2104_14960 [Leptolyngbya sp. NIES-2104]